MYAWVWRLIPGPWPIRLLVFLALIAAVVYGLFIWVYPWAYETFDISNVTVE